MDFARRMQWVITNVFVDPVTQVNIVKQKSALIFVKITHAKIMVPVECHREIAMIARAHQVSLALIVKLTTTNVYQTLAKMGAVAKTALTTTHAYAPELVTLDQTVILISTNVKPTHA